MDKLKTLVTTDWLAAHLHDPDLVLADVRWVTGDPAAGRQLFEESRIPGAVYFDVDQDLADRSDLRKGRHPLPDPKVFVQTLARKGIGRGKRVVAYDVGPGENAARLWWLLHWISGPESAVLDGGFAKWVAEGRPVDAEPPVEPQPVAPVTPLPRPGFFVSRREIEPALRRGAVLLDARIPERFRGEHEPIDRVAGHIPGAVNAPWPYNLLPGQPPVFRKPHDLRLLYEDYGVGPNTEVICYCGSGVTACHDILALELAGFHGARLYPGSWSEWIED